MKFKVTKILAEGCYKRYMWLEIGEVTYCARISDKMYYALKNAGVPTSQSLRYKKR